MKLNFSLISVLVLTLCAITRVQSQSVLDLPYASQAAQVKQRVGVTDITITYHRPLVNGRKIWGGLVPTGQVWRAGANENTTIEFSTPVSIEGKPLPAGTYGLHMIPNADTWTVIFSKMAVAWGSYTYNQSEDALRVDVKPHPTEMEEALKYRIRRSQTGFSHGDNEMGEDCGAVPRLGQPQRHSHTVDSKPAARPCPIFVGAIE